MSAFDFQAWMQHELAEVETALSGWVGTGTPDELREAMRYSVLDGGKRLRPLLALAHRSMSAVASVCVPLTSAGQGRWFPLPPALRTAAPHWPPAHRLPPRRAPYGRVQRLSLNGIGHQAGRRLWNRPALRGSARNQGSAQYDRAGSKKMTASFHGHLSWSEKARSRCSVATAPATSVPAPG